MRAVTILHADLCYHYITHESETQGLEFLATCTGKLAFQQGESPTRACLELILGKASEKLAKCDCPSVRTLSDALSADTLGLWQVTPS